LIGGRAQKYILDVELPGLTIEKFKIKIRSSQITIEGERIDENYETRNNKFNTKDYLVQDRFQGPFCVSIDFPSEGDSDKIQSLYKDGILSIHIMKLSRFKEKEI